MRFSSHGIAKTRIARCRLEKLPFPSAIPASGAFLIAGVDVSRTVIAVWLRTERETLRLFFKKAVGQFDAVGACVVIDLSRASREELTMIFITYACTSPRESLWNVKTKNRSRN